jgi:two-component system, NtrC family, nitrogen regulation response regulator NtrX
LNQILVVDDEAGIRELLSEILRDEGFEVKLAENAGRAREMRREERPDLVLLDIWMPDTDGITLLKEWAGNGQLTMPVVMMSGHGTIDTAVEATRIGAVDFLEKPISLPKLLATVGSALQSGKALMRNELTLASLGRGSVMQQLRQRLTQILPHKNTVLLSGEHGAGFELAARFLQLPNTPFIAPGDTAWLADNPFDQLNSAKDGILFLHDVSQLSRAEQKGLMQVVQKLEKFNVRLICGTTRVLTPLTDAGEFDPLLLGVLGQLTVTMPALREHAEDIPDIANTLLAQLVEAKQAPMRSFSTAGLNSLRNMRWPGNITALANAVKTLALTSLSNEIGADDVARVAAEFNPDTAYSGSYSLPLDLPLREARDAFEQVYFAHHLRAESGNMSRVADKVGLERTHLYRKLKQLGIKPSKA